MFKLVRKFRDLIVSVIDWFYQPFQKLISIETFRYGATGGLNTIFDIFLYFVFYNFVFQKQVVDLGLFSMSPHIAAFVFVFPITFSTGFLLAKFITFTASIMRGRVQLFRYGVSVGGSILLNYFFLKLFVEYFGCYATVAKVFTTIIVVVYSYVVQKHYTFKTSRRQLAKQASQVA